MSRITPQRIGHLLQATSTIVVIAVVWFAYTDYVHTTSAQILQDTKNPGEVSGMVTLLPTSRGLVILPASSVDAQVQK